MQCQTFSKVLKLLPTMVLQNMLRVSQKVCPLCPEAAMIVLLNSHTFRQSQKSAQFSSQSTPSGRTGGKRAQERGRELISTVVTGDPVKVPSNRLNLSLGKSIFFRHPDAQFRRSCEEISPGTYHFVSSPRRMYTCRGGIGYSSSWISVDSQQYNYQSNKN